MNFNDDEIRPITHRAVFSLVMEDPGICREFLEFALSGLELGIDYDSIKAGNISTEKSFVSVKMKETRVDVFISGEEHYTNIEMQNERRKAYFLPKRSKYHHMEMTHVQLSKKVPYSDLKPTVVIFVCMYDEFGCNLPRYTVKMKIEEDSDAVFDDGTITVVLNMAYRGDDLPVEERQVYEYFRTGEFDGSNEMLGRIAEKVVEVNDTRRDFIMTFEQDLMIERREGIAEGIEQGIEQEKIAGTVEMLKDGLPIEKIMQYMKLSREEIEAIEIK